MYCLVRLIESCALNSFVCVFVFVFVLFLLIKFILLLLYCKYSEFCTCVSGCVSVLIFFIIFILFANKLFFAFADGSFGIILCVFTVSENVLILLFFEVLLFCNFVCFCIIFEFSCIFCVSENVLFLLFLFFTVSENVLILSFLLIFETAFSCVFCVSENVLFFNLFLFWFETVISCKF